MRRVAVSLLVGLVLASLVNAPGHATNRARDICGLTTLDATIVVSEKGGALECGPGQALKVREDLARAGARRAATRRALASFIAMADVQLADEESPVRGEWADKCGGRGSGPDNPHSPISDSAWRPQESMVIHLMNAHVRAATAIAQRGGPVLGAPFDFTIGLGDLADNMQYNEIRWIIDIFDGGKLIDPDTGNDPVLGGDGYDGVQARDPHGAPKDPITKSPVKGERILDLANEPFWASGLRGPRGKMPWYSLPGNHDTKVQGTIPDDSAAWRHATRRYVTGHIKLMDLAPDYQARLCHAMAEEDPDEFQAVMTEIFTDPANAGTTKVIPADPDRMLLYRSDEAKEPGEEEACVAETAGAVYPDGHSSCESSWIEEHFHTSGAPKGHGYREENRCTDADGNLLARACYSFTDGLFHHIALDTNPPEGFEGGNVDPAQFEWLERELKASSRLFYDEEGKRVMNKKATDKLIVLLTHHTIESSNNLGPYSTFREGGGPPQPEGPLNMTGAHSGEELKELLLRYPNVILQTSGHTHENKIWAHEPEKGSPLAGKGLGYWEINTSALSDYPTQSRTIEIADNGDGSLSVFAVVFDAAAGADPRDIDWKKDDPTPETKLSKDAERDINEDWLASFGREVMLYDPQTDLTNLGKPGDRNVELLIKAPFPLGPGTSGRAQGRAHRAAIGAI